MFRAPRSIPMPVWVKPFLRIGAAAIVAAIVAIPALIATRLLPVRASLAGAHRFPISNAPGPVRHALLVARLRDCDSRLGFAHVFERQNIGFRLEGLVLLDAVDSRLPTWRVDDMEIDLVHANVMPLLPATSTPSLLIYDGAGVVQMAIQAPLAIKSAEALSHWLANSRWTRAPLRAPDIRGDTGRLFRTLPPVAWRFSLDRLGTESPPIAMAASGSFVMVIAADRSVVAIQVASRRIAWRWPKEAFGIVPRELVLVGTETAMILGDPGQSPVVVRLSNGSIVRRWPAVGRELMQSACALPATTIVSVVDSGQSLLYHDVNGTLQRRSTIPFPEISDQQPLLRQLLLARDDSSARCVAAVVLGDGIVGFNGSRVVWRASYREPFRTPKVIVRTSRRADGATVSETSLQDHVIAARDVTSGGGITYVAFGGTSADAGRIVDMYAVENGAYLGTLRFPQAVRRIAASGARLYASVYEAGYPVLLGFDLRPSR